MPVAFSPSLLASIVGVPRGGTGAVLAAALGAAAAIVLFSIRRSLGQTTLRSAWAWSLAAVAALAAVECSFQLQSEDAIPRWPAVRLIAAALALCPMVSVLGAKRPQDRPWNFVVLALWGVVSLPAILWLAVGRGEEFRLDKLRGMVLWVLIALPAINYLPTRFASAAALVVLGQIVVLAPHLPLIGARQWTTDPGLIALACFVAAALVVWRKLPRAPRPPPGLNFLWRAFRDQFGLFWALRVQERVNATSTTQKWPVYLSWGGFRTTADHTLTPELPRDCRRAVGQTVRQLLRRFVSPAWIAAWLPPGID